jgi:ABC-type sugar transport system permease subunit
VGHASTTASTWFVVPALVFIAGMGLYPLWVLLVMSVSEVKPATLLRDWPFVGLANFLELVGSSDFVPVVWNTLIFVAVVLVLGQGAGLVAAISMFRTRALGRITLVLMILMWALPPVVAGAIWRFLLGGDGVVNKLALKLGLVQEPGVLFLQDGQKPLFSVAFVAAWAVAGFAAIAYRATLLDVPDEIQESAAMDGANVWQTFRFILWPHLRATTLVLASLVIVYAIRSFDYIYVVTQGGPGKASSTVPFWGYQLAFSAYNYDLGAAVSVLGAIAVVIVALIYARGAVRVGGRQ